jgi:hypothetical protein
LARDKELLSALAERNAAIRLAVNAQMTTTRLQEQISQIRLNPTAPELIKLSVEISQLREMLSDQSVAGGDPIANLKRQQLETIDVAHKKILSEIASLRRQLNGVRASLQEQDTALQTQTSASKIEEQC